jgi:hypothetical protein
MPIKRCNKNKNKCNSWELPDSCDSCEKTELESVEDFCERFEKENHIKRNRKQMAWISLISCHIVVILMMFFVEESRLNLLGDVMTWFFLIMGSIVGAYIGFTTIAKDKFQK